MPTGKRLGDWIQTSSGQVFYPLDPRPEEIHIEDIAHSLSMQCRFLGHCRDFYSVAEHSVRVARELPPELQKWGLLHDAAEAYLGDMVRPLKYHSGAMGDLFRMYEAALMVAVCQAFELPIKEPAEVRRMDNVLLMTEKRDLVKMKPKPWEDTEQPLPGIIDPWSPSYAKKEFLRTLTLINHRESEIERAEIKR